LDVIEHPRLFNPKPVPGPIKATKPLDPALAQLRRLVPKVELDRVPNRGADVSGQLTELAHGARCEDDLEPHSGQILARTPRTRKRRWKGVVDRLFAPERG
jgi:hypothetical protein